MKYLELETSNSIFKRRRFKSLLEKKEEAGLCNILACYSENRSRHYIIETKNTALINLNGDVIEFENIKELGISGVIMINYKYLDEFNYYVKNTFLNPGLKVTNGMDNSIKYIKISLASNPNTVISFRDEVDSNEDMIFIDYQIRAKEYYPKIRGVEEPKDW